MFKNRFGLLILGLALGASLSVTPQVYANESAEGIDSTAPLQFGDITPEEDMVPSIDPMESGSTKTVDPTLPRPRVRKSATNPSSGSFSMPPIGSCEDLRTNWGYGTRENNYNAPIFNAVSSSWPHSNVVPLHPLLLKSLLACESGFDPNAVSYTGAVGIAQLTPETARRFGLGWSASRDPNQAIPAGVKVLAEKARVVIDPGNYHKMMGLPVERCQYAQKVAAAYKKYGPPSVEQYWYLMLAAYNGGGGTVLRAMAVASDRGLDPRDWSNLVGNRNDPYNAPLYLACTNIFGSGAMGKYREVADYPVKIIKLYNKSVAPEQRIELKTN